MADIQPFLILPGKENTPGDTLGVLGEELFTQIFSAGQAASLTDEAFALSE